MVAGNSINESTTGICGFTGTAFTGTAVTNHALIVGGATSSTLTNVGPSATTGQVLQSAGSSADPAFSTATYPSTATVTGKILRADGTNWVQTTATFPDTAGTSGNVLTSDGTNWNSTAPSGAPALTTNVVNFIDDFLQVNTGSADQAIYSTQTWDRGSSSWSTTGTPLNITNPGLITNTSSAPTLYAHGRSFRLSGGALTFTCIFNIAILSAASPRYALRIGVGDSNTGDQTNGVYVEYSDNINSGNWVFKTATASVRTTSNSTTAVTTGFHNLTITINAAATSAAFTMDGVSLGTAITTNIPTAAGIRAFFVATATVGTTTTNSFYIDLIQYQQILTTTR